MTSRRNSYDEMQFSSMVLKMFLLKPVLDGVGRALMSTARKMQMFRDSLDLK